MTQNPLISVIIAVKNGQSFIGEAIESVLANDYRPIEILVVDGKSEDATVEIAKKYEFVRIVEQNEGKLANAYNLGIKEAKGSFVSFLSCDDKWTPEKLSKQFSYLSEHPEAQFVVGKIRYFLEPGCKPPRGFRKELLEGEHVAFIMETLLARKPVFEVVGNLSEEFQTAEDVDWYARAKDLKVTHGVVDHLLVHKRVHDENLSLSQPEENTQRLLKVLRNSVKRKNASDPPAP